MVFDIVRDRFCREWAMLAHGFEGFLMKQLAERYCQVMGAALDF